MGEFTDKVAIITGAQRGAGYEIALRFAKEGIHVVMSDVGLKGVSEAFAKVKAAYPDNKGFAIGCDITNSSQIEGMVEEAVKRFAKIDILVNNAGIIHDRYRVVDLPEEVLYKVFAVNVFGTFNVSKYVGRQMIEQGNGRIINITSWYARIGQDQFAPYCASKAALISLTQSMALEMALTGVTVNGVAPGWVETDMHWNALRDQAAQEGITFEEIEKRTREFIPIHKRCTGDDLAAACLYLASPNAQVVTGQNINVNGGLCFD
jgi:NAD(P)-dependent dehydrogenase (short-subunit alcohol dehydrogenase family)